MENNWLPKFTTGKASSQQEFSSDHHGKHKPPMQNRSWFDLLSTPSETYSWRLTCLMWTALPYSANGEKYSSGQLISSLHLFLPVDVGPLGTEE